MSSYQPSDFGVSNQSTNDDDHFTVTLLPYNHSSNVSLKLPDSDSGLQGSSKATGSLKNSLSSTDGEDLQDRDEENLGDRGAFHYFPSTESSSNTHDYDECHELESDKSSIESPRSDGSSTQEYEVTQPDECELRDMTSRPGRDRYGYNYPEEAEVMGDAAENIHRRLYGRQSLPPFRFSHSGKSDRGSAPVDEGITFSLSKSEDGLKFNRHSSADDYRSLQPPFGEGKSVLNKVGSSISGLISPHHGAVENMPPGEEIKQNGGLEGDGRKRKKKKKPSAGHLGGTDDTNTEQRLKQEEVDENGNPQEYRSLSGSAIRQESSKTQSLTSSKQTSYGTIKDADHDSSPKTEPAASGPKNSDQGAASGSDGKSHKRKRQKKEETVTRAEDIADYVGNKDIDDILKYVNGHSSGKKGSKKATVAAPLAKVTPRNDSVKKGKVAQTPNDIGDKDGPVSVGVENMGNNTNKSKENEESNVMSEQAGEEVEVPEVRKEVKLTEKVPVCKPAEEGSDLKNKTKNSTKQANDKHGENNNVKKPSNKSEGASKTNKKVEKEATASAGTNKKTRTVTEPSKEEAYPAVTSPRLPDSEYHFNLADYRFTDIDSLHQPKMEGDFQPVTNKKKKRPNVKEPVQSYQNNYHHKDHKFHFSPRTASPPLTEGAMRDKSSSYDLSLAGFPALAKKGGASQKSSFHHVRRNSIGEVPVDPSKQLQDDSDIESVKSLPAAQCGWMVESITQKPLSYAKMAASKPEGPGSSPEDVKGAQKPTVWKGSLTERRHSIGSKPEKLKQDSGGSGDLRSRHKSGSQEVLKTDDKECSAVSRNQTEPAMATADGSRDLGLLAPNSEMDFPCLPVSSASLVKPSETKTQPPVTHVQSSQHSSGQNSEGAPPLASTASAPPLVNITNSAAVARSPNALVVSSASDTSSAGARFQTRSGEVAHAAQDHKRSKTTVARAPNNGRKQQPVFFCDGKSGDEPQNLDITFGYDSSIDDVKPTPSILQQQSSNSHQGVTFGLEQGDGPDTPPFTASNSSCLYFPSPPPAPCSQPSQGVSDSSKAKLGRMNGVVSGACKHLEVSGSMAMVPPSTAPVQPALGMGRNVPGVRQVIPSVTQIIPSFSQVIPGMPHGMPLMGQAMMGQGIPGMMGQGIPGMMGHPLLPSVGQRLPNVMGQGLPGAAGVGMGGHVIQAAGGHATQGVMGHKVGQKGQGTMRRVEYGALAEPAGGSRKFVMYYEIPEGRGNFNLEEVASYFQQMYDRGVTSQKCDGSVGLNRQDN